MIPRSQCAFVFCVSSLFSKVVVSVEGVISETVISEMALPDMMSKCTSLWAQQESEIGTGKGRRGGGKSCKVFMQYHLSVMFRSQQTVRCNVRTAQNQATKLVS